MTTSNQTSATETQEFAPIPKDEFPLILWKLRAIENTFNFFHSKLLDLQEVDGHLLMTSRESVGFSEVLYETYENFYSIISQLKESDDSRLRKIGEILRGYANHAAFVLNFFGSFVEPNNKSACKIDGEGFYKDHLKSVLLLLDEVCFNGLPVYIRLLEEIFSGEAAGNNQVADDGGDLVKDSLH